MTDQTFPWRAHDLPGARSDSGPTYNGGQWTGGGEVPRRSIGIRVWSPMGRPASVEVDLNDETHGCTVSLPPTLAREAAAALLVGADLAEAEMRKWRDVLDKAHTDLLAAQVRMAAKAAGEAS